jgi:chromosome segregation ATPase
MKMNLVVLGLAMCLALVVSGCSSDTADQLKKCQADQAAADKQAAELKTQIGKLQEENRALVTKYEQCSNDLKFFANKVNPLEGRAFEQARKIESLSAELEQAKKELEAAKAELKAAQEKSAVPAAPATTNGSAKPMPQ